MLLLPLLLLLPQDISYIVTDNIASPAALRSYYSEKLLIMPHSYYVNDHRQTARYAVDSPITVKRAQVGREGRGGGRGRKGGRGERGKVEGTGRL